jgi:hypothetical protein
MASIVETVWTASTADCLKRDRAQDPMLALYETKMRQRPRDKRPNAKRSPLIAAAKTAGQTIETVDAV